jgi:hypothetical protein
VHAEPIGFGTADWWYLPQICHETCGDPHFLHRQIRRIKNFLRRAINRLPLPGALYADFEGPRAIALRRAFDFCASLEQSTREAPAVDLTLKLNVLAVCAVFVFVGAILLGAF